MPVSRSHAHETRSRGPRPVAALFALLLAAVLLVAGCSASDSNDSGAGDKEIAPTQADQEGGKGADAPGSVAQPPGSAAGDAGKRPDAADKVPQAAPSYVVHTAKLRVRAKDVSGAADEAQQIAADAGGYVANETTERDSRNREHSRLVLRIPPDAYEQSLDDLAALGKVLERRTSAQDVTNEVVDIDSRVKTQRASVDRVRKLMDRADKIADVVSLETELKNRQSDLESLLAQQKSLASRTNMGTVTLTLTEPPAKPKKKEDDDKGVGAAIADALGGGWHAFYVTVRGLLVVLAAVLPFAAVAALVFVLVRRFARRYYRPGSATASAPAPADDRPGESTEE